MPFVNKAPRNGRCIYKIENATSGKTYIGQTVFLTARKAIHRDQLLNGRHPNKKMQADFNSGDTLVIKALEYFPPWTPRDTLNAKEKAYIEKYKSNVEGYNDAPPPHSSVICSPAPDKYRISAEKVDLIIGKINEVGGVTYLRIMDICKALKCQPGDILEYVED